MRAIIRCDLLLDTKDPNAQKEIREYLLSPSAKSKPIKRIPSSVTGDDSPQPPSNLDEILLDFLSSKGWLPTTSQDANLVAEKSKEILKTIKDDHLEMVMTTFLGTIIHTPTVTWGVINRPAEFRIEFRLKQPLPEKLRQACEELVNDLQEAHIPIAVDNTPERQDEHGSIRKANLIINFYPRIQILEPGSEHQASSGEIVPRQPKALWKLSRENKSVDVTVGIFASILAVILLVVTTPIAFSVIGLNSQNEWYSWTKGLLDRLATSAIFSAVISWVSVFLYYNELKAQNAIIKWVTI
jgi:hypothetical protein